MFYAIPNVAIVVFGHLSLDENNLVNSKGTIKIVAVDTSTQTIIKRMSFPVKVDLTSLKCQMIYGQDDQFFIIMSNTDKNSISIVNNGLGAADSIDL
ncbi:MAG: hypothetical protein GY804_09170 [Alphaproteobacteria bacterium]|nr:hypothetical protein [Alphaproteobacteria bacterium]